MSGAAQPSTPPSSTATLKVGMSKPTNANSATETR